MVACQKVGINQLYLYIQNVKLVWKLEPMWGVEEHLTFMFVKTHTWSWVYAVLMVYSNTPCRVYMNAFLTVKSQSKSLFVV